MFGITVIQLPVIQLVPEYFRISSPYDRSRGIAAPQNTRNSATTQYLKKGQRIQLPTCQS